MPVFGRFQSGTVITLHRTKESLSTFGNQCFFPRHHLSPQARTVLSQAGQRMKTNFADLHTRGTRRNSLTPFSESAAGKKNGPPRKNELSGLLGRCAPCKGLKVSLQVLGEDTHLRRSGAENSLRAGLDLRLNPIPQKTKVEVGVEDVPLRALGLTCSEKAHIYIYISISFGLRGSQTRPLFFVSGSTTPRRLNRLAGRKIPNTTCLTTGHIDRHVSSGSVLVP